MNGIPSRPKRRIFSVNVGQTMLQTGSMACTSAGGSRVAVIIAAYNVAEYISRAIASAQAQTVGPSEILVSDDFSSDNTCEVVQRLAEQDPRIKLLRSNRNTGPGAARNRAIEATDADWAAVLDADDSWKPQRLERLLEGAAQSGSTIVADNYLKRDDSTGRDVGPAFYEDRLLSAITISRLIESERPLGRVRFGLLKPMVRTSFLRERGIEYATNVRQSEDFHFFARVLLEGGRAVLLNEPLYIYTLPQSLVTGSQSRGSRTKAQLADRIWVADDLIRRYGESESCESVLLLRRYRQWMTDIAKGRQALDAWKTGHRWRALGLALARPRSAFSYAWTSPTMKRLRAVLAPQLARPPF